MNELVKKPDPTALAAYGERDPFEQFADDVAPRNIVGRLLRFSKGLYLIGENDQEIAAGSTFTAYVEGMLTGWIRWQDGKPTDQVMIEVKLGKRPPRRDDLGDGDRSKWPLDSRNEPRDPWQLTQYLPLLSADDELHTFSTGSAGGRGALAELSRAYARQRRMQADVLPVIALDTDTYKHRQYGRIAYPIFRVTGWEPKERFDKALVEAGLLAATASTPAQQQASMPSKLVQQFRQELDDEIPF